MISYHLLFWEQNKYLFDLFPFLIFTGLKNFNHLYAQNNEWNNQELPFIFKIVYI